MSSLNYLNRLAIAGGRLNGKTDTLEDLRVALCDLPDPMEVGVPLVQPSTIRQYTNAVRCALGGPDPRKTPAEQAWADLRTAARAVGCETSFLWAVAQAAAARDLFPTEILKTIALEILKAFDVHHARSAFRRGCEQFDALHGHIQPDLLPPSPLGIRRPPPRPPRVPKAILPPDPVQTAWADLYARLRDRGWTHKQLGALSYIRVRATTASIAPDTLNQNFVGTLEQEITKRADRKRLQAAILVISTLSKEPGFTHLPGLSILDDHRFSHGGPSERARAELENLMDIMNPAPSTRRSFRVAVGVLTDALGRPNIPLIDLLQTDITGIDFGPHECRRKKHIISLRSISDFMMLPWTPAWRKLQEHVIATGMTPVLNPVPKVLSWNPSVDPDGLTREWAQQLDRAFRSTLTNPPHGRADRAKTLARHLKAFDALHDIPEVADSGLLPPRIGAIR